MKIGECELGDGKPTFVLAEVASAHQGEAVQALGLAKTAKQSGADAIKFQLFRASELISPTDPRASTFEQIELSIEDWEHVLDGARELGLPVLADVFDRDSLKLGQKHGIAAYKIHSTDMENPEFIREVAATGAPVLLSTGGCGLGSVEAAITVCEREGNTALMLLHGVQNFPTRVEDSNLRFISTLKSMFGRPVGFLDHVDGSTDLARMLPILAVACGADMVEKHMTLDRKAKGFDYESALEKSEFQSMVTLIRDGEKSFGEARLPRSSGFERYHNLMRRAVMSGVALKQGEPLKRNQLTFLRSETGLAPYEASRLLGRRPRQDVAAFEPLTEDLFE